MNDIIKALEGLRHKVWLEDIESPNCPEYVEHHASIQKILKEIDSMIKSFTIIEEEDYFCVWCGANVRSKEPTDICKDCLDSINRFEDPALILALAEEYEISPQDIKQYDGVYKMGKYSCVVKEILDFNEDPGYEWWPLDVGDKEYYYRHYQK